MPRRFIRSLPAVLCLWAAVLSGCASLRTHTAPNPFEIAREEYPRMFRATEEVLREEGFALSRHDYRFGRIDTEPLPAPTMFEPWRPTSTTLGQGISATINYQQRIAIVTLVPVPIPPEAKHPEPPAAEANAPSTTQPAPPATLGVTDQPTSYMMKVEVQLQQLEVPDRQLTGSTRGQTLQGELNEAPFDLRERGIPNNSWRPIGRDPVLEQRLLAAIVRRSLQVE